MQLIHKHKKEKQLYIRFLNLLFIKKWLPETETTHRYYLINIGFTFCFLIKKVFKFEFVIC